MHEILSTYFIWLLLNCESIMFMIEDEERQTQY